MKIGLTLTELAKGSGRGLLVRAEILRWQHATVDALTAKWEMGENIRQALYPDWPIDEWWAVYGRGM